MTPNKEEVIKMFEEARRLLSDPERWTKGASARDRNGIPIGSLNHNATCWCSFGAIDKVVNYNVLLQGYDIWLTKYLGKSYIQYNDLSSTTHEDIMKMFDETIDLIKREL